MKYYAFDEPVAGYEPDKGQHRTCCQTIVMSETDAISYWREMTKNIDLKHNLADAEVLDDFIVINWAYEVELIKKEQSI
jgi:hypothetical protein